MWCTKGANVMLKRFLFYHEGGKKRRGILRELEKMSSTQMTGKEIAERKERGTSLERLWLIIGKIKRTDDFRIDLSFIFD